MNKSDRFLPTFFRNFPLLDEDFWDLDFVTRSGLSVYEDNQHIYVEAAFPGLSPKDITITLEKGGILWIRGEKKEEEKNKEAKYYRKASNSFSYRVLVPTLVDEQKEPEANYENGVMKVTFIKAQQSQPKRISVRTNTTSN